MFIYCICTQYLVGAHFALITGSIRRVMEVISLWHCWGGVEAQVSLTVAFSSSAFFGLLFLIFLLTIPHRFSMFRSGEFAGQSNTPTPCSFNQLLVLLSVWAGAKSCWKMKSASLKSWSAEGSMKCSSFLVNGCSDVGFQKTQWSNNSRWHCTQIITIKRTKDLNYFSLCALNWFNTREYTKLIDFFSYYIFSQNMCGLSLSLYKCIQLTCFFNLLIYLLSHIT